MRCETGTPCSGKEMEELQHTSTLPLPPYTPRYIHRTHREAPKLTSLTFQIAPHYSMSRSHDRCYEDVLLNTQSDPPFCVSAMTLMPTGIRRENAAPREQITEGNQGPAELSVSMLTISSRTISFCRCLHSKQVVKSR